MTKSFLLLFICCLSISKIFSQYETYSKWENNNLRGDLMKFYPDHRFMLTHDESCYAYSSGAGFYQISNDTVFLDFFKLIPSQSEIVKLKNNGIFVNISVEVFSLKDSTPINNATVFAKVTSKEIYDIQGKVDSKGTRKFNLPIGTMIEYLRVYAHDYIDFDEYIVEKFETDYLIKIYLSGDPLTDLKYSGPIDRREIAIKKGKKKIIYNGIKYKNEN